jgi:Fe-S-cluster containining protein
VAGSAFFFGNHVINVVETATPLPHPLACLEGCNFCCYNLLEVTPPEALFLGYYVEREFSDLEKRELLEVLEKAAAFRAGKDKKQLAGMRQELACPLLKDGRCAAYPARPLMCRAMHSLDAAQCREAFYQGDRVSPPYYAHRHDITFAIGQGLLAGCRAAGLQSRALELSRALLDCLTQERPRERWIQGEEIF